MLYGIRANEQLGWPTAGYPVLDADRLRRVLVPVVHAPPRRAAGQRDVRDPLDAAVGTVMAGGARPRVFVSRLIPDAGLDPIRAACDAEIWDRRAAALAGRPAAARPRLRRDPGAPQRPDRRGAARPGRPRAQGRLGLRGRVRQHRCRRVRAARDRRREHARRADGDDRRPRVGADPGRLATGGGGGPVSCGRASGRPGDRSCCSGRTSTARRSGSSASAGSGRRWRGARPGFGMPVVYTRGTGCRRRSRRRSARAPPARRPPRDQRLRVDQLRADRRRRADLIDARGPGPDAADRGAGQHGSRPDRRPGGARRGAARGGHRRRPRLDVTDPEPIRARRPAAGPRQLPDRAAHRVGDDRDPRPDGGDGGREPPRGGPRRPVADRGPAARSRVRARRAVSPRACRSPRSGTLFHGPVAQWQSRGLLIPGSRVRIPPGSLSDLASIVRLGRSSAP